MKMKKISNSSSFNIEIERCNSVSSCDEIASHLVSDYNPPVNYDKYIIDPDEVSILYNMQLSREKEIIKLNSNSSNKELQPKRIKPNNKIEILPISQAKEKVMRLMKTSNDDYMLQVENLKKCENTLKSISNAIKKMGPVKFDIMHHPILYEIAMLNYTIDYCNEDINRIKQNIDSFAILYNEINKILGDSAPSSYPESSPLCNAISPDSKIAEQNEAPSKLSFFGFGRRKSRSKQNALQPPPSKPVHQQPQNHQQPNQLQLNNQQQNNRQVNIQQNVQQNRPQQNVQQNIQQNKQQQNVQQNKQQQNVQQNKQQQNVQQNKQQQNVQQQNKQQQNVQQNKQQQVDNNNESSKDKNDFSPHPRTKRSKTLPYMQPLAVEEDTKHVDLGTFLRECITPRNRPKSFLARRILLRKLGQSFSLDHEIQFLDSSKPEDAAKLAEMNKLPETKESSESNKASETKESAESNKSPSEASNADENSKADLETASLLAKISVDAKMSFVIDPRIDKVGYLMNPKVKSGIIVQRFILSAGIMNYDDVDVIADALHDLTSDYLTKDEIIGILFDIMWTLNPSKYPLIPTISSFWIPYIMDLIPATLNPPYLSDKWKRMTFQDLSNNTEWPLKKPVDSLFDLYLYSDPFEIGRSFSNTIRLVAEAVEKMVVESGGKAEEIEIDFDQLFCLLIVCIFASGLPTVTLPLMYASSFDDYAEDNETKFAMSHIEGLFEHLKNMNFMEMRSKSNMLKEQFEKETEKQ